ncbi:C2H2 finger domain transcription factor crzA [Drechslerella dactyloides]|uniref:C2H2 finger domain transcription factor crzA n=1 Tax=Drechslerella dactyloides TaxID=74499 RepID=A0AAD6J101_DREDA|nr:C2H2 finger domain transcription factor crzA [Drechslerella dactyloides]
MAPEPVQVSAVPSITTNGTPPERPGSLATDTTNPASPRRSPSPSVLPPIQPPYLGKTITEGLLAAATRRSMSPNPHPHAPAEAAEDGTSQNPAAILTSQTSGMSKPSEAPVNAAPPAPGPKLAPIETGAVSRLSSSGPSGPTSAVDALTSPHSATSASAESGLTATAGLGSDTSPTRPRLGSISEALGPSYLGSATPSTPYSPTELRQSASYPDPRASISSASGSRGKHECPNCHQTFTRHHNLKSHLLTHSHEKPFQCITCQSRFRRLHDLKRHQKLHTGERPHVCDSCGRRFARADALARHNRGEGGCAGRRSSMGGLDPGYDNGDGMEGIEATGGDDEAMHDYPSSPTAAAGRKAVSLPNARSRHSYSRARAQARQAQNLQPAPLPPRSNSNHSYPPINPNIPSSFTAPAPPSINTSQAAGPSILQQGSLTDSPRALSPSNPGFPVPAHDSTSLGPPVRSPSFSTPFHPMDSNRRQSTVGGSYSLPQPAQTSPRGHNIPLPGSLSRPGSFSSTHLAPPDHLTSGQSAMFGSNDQSIWSYIKDLEKRIRDLEEKNQNMEAKIHSLTGERSSSISQPAPTGQESG